MSKEEKQKLGVYKTFYLATSVIFLTLIILMFCKFGALAGIIGLGICVCTAFNAASSSLSQEIIDKYK